MRESNLYNPTFHIVLYCPEIPQNTGNIGRTAVAGGAHLHLIHPLGFSLDEKATRRAGLDYWKNLTYFEYDSWDHYLDTCKPKNILAFTTKAEKIIWNCKIVKQTHLLFGPETKGLPISILDYIKDNYCKNSLVKIPMMSSTRSLNLATAVYGGLYEGLRQINFSP